MAATVKKNGKISARNVKGSSAHASSQRMRKILTPLTEGTVKREDIRRAVKTIIERRSVQ